METRKIALACFIGGVLCGAVALMFAPVYWWLGLLAGMAGGYLSYEFSDVRASSTIALRVAGQGFASAWITRIQAMKVWLSSPHPFVYVGAILPLWILYVCLPDAWNEDLGTAVVLTVAVFVAYAVYAMVASALLYGVADIGKEVVRRDGWYSSVMDPHGALRLSVRERGVASLGYSNAAKLFTIGVLEIIRFFVWTIWKSLAIALWTALCFALRYAWLLCKLIHSEKRVLCAIHGTLGGAASYLTLASPTMSVAEQFMVVVFGGMLGAAFGVAGWHLVPKRLPAVSK